MEEFAAASPTGERVSEVGRVLGLSESTVCTIRDNAEKLKNNAQSGASANATKTSYGWSSIMEHTERMPSTWIEDQNQRNIPGSMFLAQGKARAIHEKLQKDEEGPLNHSVLVLVGLYFRRRYGYHNIKMSGEAASADAVAAEEFIRTLNGIIEEGGYFAKQIFNLDETVLFWKRMPARTYISREEKSAPGFKAAKDRYTRKHCEFGKESRSSRGGVDDVQELFDSHKELWPQDLLDLEKEREDEEAEKKEEPEVV
ncbi:tigger transposable element-derived protein 1-like [Homarus americanus]|uniref:tigger transposable element-derived protein 1-like n=1 Tax=Homarus americanus TaxID=6706 RepID=UPI001C43A5EB|nr:tigger transposable element-derived protein 1-like [Homarus americanus]